MNEIDLAIFDLAGTTVHDDNQVPTAFKSALAAIGAPLDDKMLTDVRGASKREAMRALTSGRFPPADHERRAAGAYADFVERLSNAYRQNVRPIEGAADTFRRLRERGVKVALNTGFDREITDLLIGALGWKSEVDVIVCADDVASGRPAPDLIRAAMRSQGVPDARRVANVGDTLLDLRAAEAAGVGWSFGVLSGAHDRDTLGKGPEAILIESVRELESELVARGVLPRRD